MKKSLWDRFGDWCEKVDNWICMIGFKEWQEHQRALEARQAQRDDDTARFYYYTYLDAKRAAKRKSMAYQHRSFDKIYGPVPRRHY